MISRSSTKWTISLILSFCLLILALIGGNWGSTYAASTKDTLLPYINRIEPAAVQVGSPYIVMIITGGNFDINKNPRIRLTAPGLDQILEAPLMVLPDGISQIIRPQYLVSPITYELFVVQSSSGSIPTIPIEPGWDEISNPARFVVYEPEYIHIPIVKK